MSPLVVIASLSLFVLAGLAEIGGGYLVWLWLREGRSVLLGILGAAVLFVYGVVPTLQPAPFGRVYAAYGGVFVVLSLLWGAIVAREAPDRFDVLGALLGALGGVVLFVYGVVPTLQPAPFGRAYAAYGGVFVVLSLLWSGLVAREMPDRFDLVGGLVCLVGVAVIMYAPRS